MELKGLAELSASYGSTKSTDKTPFPLAAYLTIYEKASIDCRMDYMEGARVLKEWLGPISFPLLGDDYKVPQLLRTYEFVELAKILAPMQFGRGDWLEVLAATEGYMYWTLAGDVLWQT